MTIVTCGVDMTLDQLIFSGFCIAFVIWAISRAIRFIFELANSRSGHIKDI